MSKKTENFTLISHKEDGIIEEKVISIKGRTRFDKAHDECSHNQVLVDEELWSIQCEECGEKLNPIEFLLRLAGKEAVEEYRTQELRKEYQRITDILALKTKTRCEHCKKITTVNTEADIKKSGLLLRYVDTKKNQELNKKVPHWCKESKNSTHEFYLLRETEEIKIYVCKHCGKTITEENHV